MPKPPRRWGADLASRVMPSISSVDARFGREIVEVDDEHTLVRFPPLHLRPHSRHELGDVVVVAWPNMAGETLTLDWRAPPRRVPRDT